MVDNMAESSHRGAKNKWKKLMIEQIYATVKSAYPQPHANRILGLLKGITYQRSICPRHFFKYCSMKKRSE